MTHNDVVQWIDYFAPKELACEWDNVGLMTGDLNDKTKNILFCLDLTLSDIIMAAKSNVNLIITHHPLIFDKEEIIKDGSLLRQKLDALEKAKITVYSAHTNLDFAPGGINDVLFRKLKLGDMKKYDNDTHVIGQLSAPETLGGFFDRISADFGSFNAKLIKPKGLEIDDNVVSVAVCCGAFDGETDYLVNNKVDVVVTGEMKLSRALELMELGIAAIELGHYETEISGIKSLAAHLKKSMQGQLEQDGVAVRISPNTNPYYDIIGVGLPE
ncbi:MAG: Nif3-like dinuclear metal center hexameric protein [Clostridia bacterium]|nr:Nif3-like dinuclear metal center hexameric protein [Clostridia bacterium]